MCLTAVLGSGKCRLGSFEVYTISKPYFQTVLVWSCFAYISFRTLFLEQNNFLLDFLRTEEDRLSSFDPKTIKCACLPEAYGDPIFCCAIRIRLPLKV